MKAIVDLKEKNKYKGRIFDVKHFMLDSISLIIDGWILCFRFDEVTILDIDKLIESAHIEFKTGVDKLFYPKLIKYCESKNIQYLK
jgi:hypothetical protein